MISTAKAKMEHLLACCFPPKLGHIVDWPDKPIETIEQGSAGNVKQKKYRDGIERYFAENHNAKREI
jgi:hypothetical protein